VRDASFLDVKTVFWAGSVVLRIWDSYPGYFGCAFFANNGYIAQGVVNLFVKPAVSSWCLRGHFIALRRLIRAACHRRHSFACTASQMRARNSATVKQASLASAANMVSCPVKLQAISSRRIAQVARAG